MNVLHTIASLRRAAGGPSRSVTALCDQLSRHGAGVNLLTVGIATKVQEWVLPDPQHVNLHTCRGFRLPCLRVNVPPSFCRAIADLHREKKLDLIHDHGLWLPSNYLAAKAARKLGLPLVVSTRGMLEPWALRYRGWKKRLVWLAWQRAPLKAAALLHATSPEEADNLRELGLNNPIAIVPNGVDLPEPVDTDSKSERNDFKSALFLSRIHPKKGLVNLVNAWAIVKPCGWKLVIAGPDEGGHAEEVKMAVANAGLQDQVEFAGAVDDQQKWPLYRQADLFVLPTFSENFGIVIAEALAAEVPVITTKGTPWSDLVEYECGWWVDLGVEPLADALREAMALSDAVRREMGRRGRALVAEKYSWEKIAKDMLSAYRWALGEGPRPECVRLD